MSRSLNSKLSKSADDIMDRKQHCISRALLEPETVLNFIADTVRDLLRNDESFESVQEYLRHCSSPEFQERMNLFDYVSVYGYFDKFDTFYDGNGWTPDETFLPQESPWYKAAVENNGSIAISPPYIDVLTQTAVVAYACSLFDETGKQIGVIALDVPLTYLWKQLCDTPITQGSIFFLVDEEYKTILPLSEFVGKPLSESSPAIRKLSDKIEQGSDVSLYRTRNYLGVKSVFFGRRIDNGWFLGMAIPESEYYQDLYHLVWVISLLGVSLAFMLSVMLIHIEKVQEKLEDDILHKSVVLNDMERAREEDEYTQLMLDAIPLCTHLWTPDIKCIACNRETLNLFSLENKQDFIDRFFDLSPEYQPGGILTKVFAAHCIQRTFEDGYFRCEWTHQMKTGELFPTEVTLVRISHKGTTIAAGCTRDLRESRAMLAEINNRIAEQDRQLGVLRTLNHTAASLLQLSTGDHSDILKRSMESLCQQLNTARIYLWENLEGDDGELYFKLAFKWTLPQYNVSDHLPAFSYRDTLPSWVAICHRHDAVNGPIDLLPSEECTFLSTHQIQSLLAVPIFIQDTLWGFAAVDDCQSRRSFNENEEQALRSWGLMVVGDILRTNALKKLEAVVTNNRGIIWSIDENRVVTVFNGQYLHELGITPSTIEGIKINAVNFNKDLLIFFENAEKTFTDGPQNWITKFGDRVFHSYTSVIQDQAGNTVGIVGSMHDITETITLQQKLHEALESAEIANKAKSSFLASMSHEIRTPMNAILGTTEILMHKKSIPSDIEEGLNVIYGSCNVLLGIINDILDFSKIEAGKLEIMPVQYSVESLIRDSIHMNIMRIADKPVEFELQINDNIPSELFGDALRIKQIQNNLLSNACKYTDTGKIILSVDFEYDHEQEMDIVLILSVQDSGNGMTKEQLDQLFEEYTRFNTDGKRTIEGIGLGLPITRRLVDLMDGEIDVESELNKGSVFTVRLPQKSVGAGVLGEKLAENLRQHRSHHKSRKIVAQFHRSLMPYGKVLIVDDVETNLYVSVGLLKLYGLQIETAMSGVEAISKIHSGQVYDIIFMDHMMPGMSGIEITKKLREWGYQKSIVALTANAVVGQSDMFLANGFDAFISKPIDTRELNVILNNLIKERNPLEVRKFWSSLEQIEGLSLLTGLDRVDGQIDVYKKTLKFSTIENERRCTVLKKLLEDNDMENFRIEVHGVKGTLANIGAMGLAAKANDLEEASKKMNAEFCADHFPFFLEELNRLNRKLKDIFSTLPHTDGPLEIPAELPPILERILLACNETDFVQIDKELENMNKLNLNGVLKEKMGQIEDAVIMMEYDEAAKQIEQLIDQAINA